MANKIINYLNGNENEEVPAKASFKPLKMNECIEIFKNDLKEEYQSYDSYYWKKLANHLERHPLCIKIISAFIKEEVYRVRVIRFDLEEFLFELKDFFKQVSPEFETSNYNKTELCLISYMIEHLKKELTTYCLDMLRFMAYLDADHIYGNILMLPPMLNNLEHRLVSALTRLKQFELFEHEFDNYLKIKMHQTMSFLCRKYDLKEQNGSMFKDVLRIILSGEMIYHSHSIFKYVKDAEYKEKSLEFYYENTSLAELYLIQLARFHCHEILKELLPNFKEKNIEKDIYNKTLNEMLFEAIYNKNNDLFTIKLLIDYGAKIDTSSNFYNTNGFLRASEWLSIELFDCLLESNDSEKIINSKDISGRTILHLLVEKWNKETFENTISCMKHLISNWKADISIKDNNDNTILNKACENETTCFRMIKLFIEKCDCKSLVNGQSKFGSTPLQILITQNASNSDLMEIILYFVNECEADIKIEDMRKWNTLFYVCSRGTSKIIEYLVKNRNCGQFINNQDILGNVAFTQIIGNELIKEQEKIKLMKLFIGNNMDVKIANNKNKTLAEIAEEKKYKKLSHELKKQIKSFSSS